MAANRTLLRAALLALASLPAATLAVPAMAQTGSALHAGILEVPLNKSEVVSADRPIAKAMIGNDQVADILPITDRSVYVLGKKMGTTSLTLYDAGGRVIAVMDVAVGPDVQALKTQLSQLVPGQPIEASISNESIVLTGLVNNPAAIDRAVQLARTYAGDKVVNLIALGSSQQVQLEVRFAEVNRVAGREIGINGFGISNNGSFSAITGRGSAFVPGVVGTETITVSPGGDITTTIDGGKPAFLGTPGITGMFGILRKQFSIGNVDIDGILSALESRGFAKTLAQPTLVSLSGERAAFLAGGEFPVPVAQSGGGGGVGGGNNTAAITVEFKPFGVSLGFTPTVLGDKTINLIVEPEVSEIDPTASLTLNGITIPGLRTRRASTTLELRDGESFAIAGLLQRDIKTNIQQMPILGSIPILGALFRSTQYQKGETELLIVVTPRLVAPIRPGQVRLPTDRVKDPDEAKTFLLGQPFEENKLPPPAADDPQAQAAPKAADKQAAAELPAKKDDDYAY